VQTTSSARFRTAVLSDHDELVELMLAFSLEVEAPLSREHISAAVLPLLQESVLGEIWVAQEALLVGYLVLSWGWGIESGGREALIDEVFVSPSSRAAGVATGLVSAALERARSISTRAVFLETESQNPRSRKLYEQLGFEVEPSVWMRRQL
jgi:ribosomal protein S18 acetylase RimI-like enzyme